MPGHIIDSYITKIEGHGRLKYSVKDKSVKVEIDEGERLFEKLVIGQSYKDIPFIVARICGVCPTSHALGSIRAIENAFGIEVNDSINNLRRALQAAQIVQSHGLHLFFLALPDYLKVKSGLDLHDKNPHVFKIATKIKGVADEAIRVIGGRAVHPVTPTIGGFTTVPARQEIEELITKIRGIIPQATETLELFAGFRYPYLNRKTEYFSLTEKGRVDILGNTIVSTGGVEASALSYPEIITEKVKSYSTAKFAEHEGHGFMVGAIARVNLMETSDFNPRTEKAINSLDIKLPITNGYKNNLAQAIELLHFIEEMELALTAYLHGRHQRTKLPYQVKASMGIAAIEAPRGTLYHAYKFDKDGIVVDCDIITPTVQNLTNLEDDANQYLDQNKNITMARRERELEMLVRAYDPCITCSVH